MDDDLVSDLRELLEDLESIRLLPPTHPRRDEWMSRKIDILARIAGMGDERPALRAVLGAEGRRLQRLELSPGFDQCSGQLLIT